MCVSMCPSQLTIDGFVFSRLAGHLCTALWLPAMPASSQPSWLLARIRQRALDKGKCQHITTRAALMYCVP